MVTAPPQFLIRLDIVDERPAAARLAGWNGKRQVFFCSVLVEGQSQGGRPQRTWAGVGGSGGSATRSRGLGLNLVICGYLDYSSWLRNSSILTQHPSPFPPLPSPTLLSTVTHISLFHHVFNGQCPNGSRFQAKAAIPTVPRRDRRVNSREHHTVRVRKTGGVEVTNECRSSSPLDLTKVRCVLRAWPLYNPSPN